MEEKDAGYMKERDLRSEEMENLDIAIKDLENRKYQLGAGEKYGSMHPITVKGVEILTHAIDHLKNLRIEDVEKQFGDPEKKTE